MENSNICHQEKVDCEVNITLLLQQIDNCSIDDVSQKTELLLSVGRIFEKQGASAQSLARVYNLLQARQTWQYPQIRQAVLFALGKSRSPALYKIFFPFFKSPDPKLSMLACQLAGYAREEQAIDGLERVLCESKSQEVCEVAVWALGQIGSEQARRILARLLMRAHLIDATIRATGAASHPDLLPSLTAPLCFGTLSQRISAAQTIRIILESQPEPERGRYLDRNLRESLAHALRDSHPSVREEAQAVDELSRSVQPEPEVEPEISHPGYYLSPSSGSSMAMACL